MSQAAGLDRRWQYRSQEASRYLTDDCSVDARRKYRQSSSAPITVAIVWGAHHGLVSAMPPGLKLLILNYLREGLARTESLIDFKVGSTDDMHNQFKVLYVAPHGLGDLIMSLRAMEVLAGQGARITVLVKSRGEADYLRHTSDLVFDEILVLDTFRKGGKLLGNAGLAWKLRRARFSAAVPQMNVNIKHYDFMLRSAGVKGRRKSVDVLREATASGGPIHNRHKVDLNVDMAAQILGISAPGGPVAVWPSRPLRSTYAPRIALAPGSGEVEAHKRWPAVYYAELARSLRTSYPEADIRIYGSPSEAALCAEIEATAHGAAVVARIGSVTDLFDALRETDICVANCNGASHVAAHAGVAVVGIYGPTQAEHTGAHCSRMVQVNRVLDCAPCYRRGYITGCGHPVCLTELEVDLVRDAVLRLLRGTPAWATP